MFLFSIPIYFLVGINAWQALEIVFLFLTTSTLIIILASSIFYRLQKGFHYYLAILAVFCAWPAGNLFEYLRKRFLRFNSIACVGISGLFVFGFSVYNVSPAPHNLQWCFYVNIVSVILSIIAAILLTVYDILLKMPMKSNDDDAPLETFTDFNGYPATYSPSTFVVVRRNKKKRKKPYEYPQILYPQQYFPTHTPNTDYITNPNYQMMTSYNAPIPPPQRSSPYRDSGVFPSQSTTSMPLQTRYYQPPVPTYRYQPPHWRRTESNPINYNSEPVNDYIQRGIYRPARLNPVEPKEEPRMLHYYTGYDHFSSIDPSDAVLTRHHPPYPGRASPVRYSSYYAQNEYIKSAM